MRRRADSPARDLVQSDLGRTDDVHRRSRFFRLALALARLRCSLLRLVLAALFHASYRPRGRMLAATLTPFIRAIVLGCTFPPLFRRNVGSGLEVLTRHRAGCDLGVGLVAQLYPSGGEAVRKFDEAIERRQVGNVVGQHQRFDRRARRQGRGVAGVVVAVAVRLIDLPDLAITDELRALLRGRTVCRGEDKLGAREARQGGRVLESIGGDELVERVDAENECPAEIAGGLQAVLDAGKGVERVDLVKEIPGA